MSMELWMRQFVALSTLGESSQPLVVTTPKVRDFVLKGVVEEESAVYSTYGEYIA